MLQSLFGIFLAKTSEAALGWAVGRSLDVVVKCFQCQEPTGESIANGRANTLEYWALYESVRTDKGPRQRIVARLGKFTGEDPHEEAGWGDLQALLEGRPVQKQPRLDQAAGSESLSAAHQLHGA